MSTWYDQKGISIELVRNSITHFNQRRIVKKEEIERGHHQSFGIFETYLGNCRFLCAGLLYLREFEKIKEIHKNCAEISYQGQEIYGFKSRESKYMIHDAILCRNKKFYQDLANSLLEQEIYNDVKGLKGYGNYSLFSLLDVITQKKESTEILKKFQISEKTAIKNHYGIGVGEAGALYGIAKRDENKIIKNVISLLEYRNNIYRKQKELPTDIFGFASYILYLAKDTRIISNVEKKIPEKYHQIIIDVLSIE